MGEIKKCVKIFFQTLYSKYGKRVFCRNFEGKIIWIKKAEDNYYLQQLDSDP